MPLAYLLEINENKVLEPKKLDSVQEKLDSDLMYENILKTSFFLVTSLNLSPQKIIKNPNIVEEIFRCLNLEEYILLNEEMKSKNEIKIEWFNFQVWQAATTLKFFPKQ